MHSNGGPIPGSYWVQPGALLAGPYPGEYALSESRGNFMRMLQSGVRSFVSLMEAREEDVAEETHARYVPILMETADRLGVECQFDRFAIPDMSVPEPARLEAALACVQSSLDRGLPTYVHCWAGRGRTGTLIGLWLIRQGLATPDNFTEVIASLRPNTAGRSPETDQQVAFVKSLARP
jgi:protein tyrosine phosphatase